MNCIKRLLLCVLFALLGLAPAYAQDIRNGADVLRAMHDRYEASWYSTLTFTQKSTTYNPDGTSKVETWHEAALLPGKLRIDFGMPSDGNGAILSDGTVTLFRGGKTSGSRASVNMLLVLGFDVYRQPVEATIKVVESEGYDLTKLREDVWEGQPAYVVGADKGDLTSKQFWVEKGTLLFVRVIEPSPNDPKQLDDIRFADYRRLEGGWVAARVEVKVGDKLVFAEEYSDIQGNVKLDPATFDPSQFNSTHWEKP
jgi:outer membrane lipoprotein-sorting protein